MTVYTAKVGTNADQLPDILALYATPGCTIADVAWGNGAFWRNIDIGQYDFHASDLELPKDGSPIPLNFEFMDFRALQYEDASIDVVVLDPPYMHRSPAPLKEGLDPYRNNARPTWGAKAIYQMYWDGMIEAKRVLKPGGVLILKCQDQVESGNQCFDHIVLYSYAVDHLGYVAEDLFMMIRKDKPMMRHNHQVHARKNHSYWWVLRKKG